MMRPKRGSDVIQIPVTVDYVNRGIDNKSKKLWGFLILGFWLFISTMALLVAKGFWKIGIPLLTFIFLSYVFRFLIIREHYYRERRKELIENNYLFPHTLFWDIYEISDKYPYIAYFANGLKAVFVALDKDVIVGKEDDADYDHYEAIADAYQQMVKRGIECIHIDYMDVVGKDERLGYLFSQVEKIKNPDLKKIMLRKYDYMQHLMNNVYSSYDVYVFYFTGREDLFWDDLQEVLDYFRQANYIRARVLNKEEIGLLVQSLMNLEDFSVNRACDSVFKASDQIEYIRPIWVEKDGERKILNPTREELEAHRRIRKSERKVRRKDKGIFGRKKNIDEDISLFD